MYSVTCIKPAAFKLQTCIINQSGNTVDPDWLASIDAKRSESTVFSIKIINSGSAGQGLI